MTKQRPGVKDWPKEQRPNQVQEPQGEKHHHLDHWPDQVELVLARPHPLPSSPLEQALLPKEVHQQKVPLEEVNSHTQQLP